MLMCDFQAEHIKLFKKASVTCYRLHSEARGQGRLFYLSWSRQAGYEEQSTSVRAKMIRQAFQKSIDGLPTALSPVQGIVDPSTVSFCLFGRQVGWVEDYEIESPTNPLEQVGPYYLDLLCLCCLCLGRVFLCCPDGMWIYVCRQEAIDPESQFQRDNAASAADLEHPIPGPRLGQGGFEEKKGIFFRSIDLLGSKL